MKRVPECNKDKNVFDIQGDSLDEARNNLLEALELFFECATSDEVQTRLHDEVYATQLEVAVG